SYYKIFLENENFHKVKRIYLLAALILSYSLPLITFSYEVAVDHSADMQVYEEIDYAAAQSDNLPSNLQYFAQAAIAIYIIGFFFWGFRFYKNLRSLLREAKSNDHLKEFNYIFVLLGKKLDPYSFFNYIFLNKKEFKKDKISQAVIEHEKAHVDQKHSIDLLFIELLKVVFWFNPLFNLIKRSIKLNHEFLADEKVLSKEFNALEYSNILFNYTSGYHHNSLSSPINHSLIKKRIIMITKDFSIKKLLIRAGLFVPVLGGCIFLFNNEIIAKPVHNNSEAVVSGEIIEVPFKKKMSSFNSNLQEPRLKIRIEGTKLWLNEKPIKPKDFASAIDAYTAEMSNEELKDLNIHMKRSDVDKGFLEELNQEFIKTRFARVTGHEILPPPPPLPPSPAAVPPPPKVEGEVAKPPHPPKPDRVIEAPQKHSEKESQRLMREKQIELEKQSREVERNAREVVREASEIEREARITEKEAMEIEREAEIVKREARIAKRRAIEIEKEQNNIPAPPPPPDPIESIKELKKEGASFFHNGKEISASEAIKMVRAKNYSKIEIHQTGDEGGKLEIID
ncbi:MAG: M56 family metallopeptidase, partial [Christiangramia sp.]|nr:M56 family metallopeptidase [Christiangramia sp.]